MTGGRIIIKTLTIENMQNSEGIKVVERFFIVLEDLPLTGKIKFINDFYVENKVNRRNIGTLKKEKHRDIMKLDWLTVMVDKYGVSADYLLTGKGEMYKK